jgi:hypothetical protein
MIMRVLQKYAHDPTAIAGGRDSRCVASGAD